MRIRGSVLLTLVGNSLHLCSPNVSSSHENLEPETETESVVSLRRDRPRRRDSSEHGGGEGTGPGGRVACELGREASLSM